MVNVSGSEPSQPRLVLRSPSGSVHIVGLSLSMSSIYWVDQSSNTVYKSSRDGLDSKQYFNTTQSPYAVSVYNSSRKGGEHTCTRT